MTEIPRRKLQNLKKAFRFLEEALADPVAKPRDLGGIIKAFENTYELAWRALKAALDAEGQSTTGPKDVIRHAFQFNFIGDETVWLEIIQDRNLTVHTYDEQFAKDMVTRIRSRYVKAFRKLIADLENQG